LPSCLNQALSTDRFASGTGFAVFGSVLQEIFYFKPQVIYVSIVFLTVLSYVLGEFMAYAIPRKGILKWLNPGPFNGKEHAAITLMASAAAQSALSTEALAAQQLFYGGFPSRAAAVFITLSSQLIGYGIAGLLRDVLVYPTKMLWPMNLPVSSLLESLHRDKRETKKKLKLFYIVFFVMFFWEVIPEVSAFPQVLQSLLTATSTSSRYWREFQSSAWRISIAWSSPTCSAEQAEMKAWVSVRRTLSPCCFHC
jgi:hypothetical protein